MGRILEAEVGRTLTAGPSIPTGNIVNTLKSGSPNAEQETEVHLRAPTLGVDLTVPPFSMDFHASAALVSGIQMHSAGEATAWPNQGMVEPTFGVTTASADITRPTTAGSSFSKMLKGTPPPRFGGKSDPTVWLTQLELHFRLGNVFLDDHKIVFAMSLLDGVAAIWATGDPLVKSRLINGGWDQFSRELSGMFSVGDRITAAKDELRYLPFKPHTDFLQFLEQFRSLLIKIPRLKESQKIDYFEYCLLSDLLAFVRVHKVPGMTFDTLRTLLINQANLLKQTKFQGGSLPSLYKQTNSTAVNRVQHSQGLNLDKRPCDHCGGQSHSTRRCWKLHGHPRRGTRGGRGKCKPKEDAFSS